MTSGDKYVLLLDINSSKLRRIYEEIPFWKSIGFWVDGFDGSRRKNESEDEDRGAKRWAMLAG